MPCPIAFLRSRAAGAALGAAASLVTGRPAAAQSATPAPAPVVTRADLAAAYQRVDAWLMTHPPDSATAVAANRLFDQSTLAFFAGRTADAIRALNRLYGQLRGDTAADGDLVRTASLRVVATPPVYVRGALDAGLALVPVVPLAGVDPLDLEVRLVDARGRTAARADVEIAPASMMAVRVPFATRAVGRLGAGRYRVIAAPRRTTPEVTVGTWDVVTTSPDAERARLAMRSVALDTMTHPQAVAAFRARLANLVSTPSVDQSAQFLSDPTALGDALGKEADALAASRDPYTASGDLWRIIVGPGGRPLPVRVIVPPDSGRRLARPLVIALHGAGGDENMFPDAYGAGEVVRQAARRGAILVSPATTVFQRDPAMLDSVIAVVQRAYAIDTTRVFLIGHSMGAAATYAAAAARPARSAATVLLYGAGRPPASGATMPPSLWIAGGLDPVFPTTRIKPAAEAATAAGAPVEYRERPTAGHTLGVGPMLEDAFHFLFAPRAASGNR